MKFTTPVIFAAIIARTMAAQAPKVSNNPVKAIAIADFPQGGTNKKTLGNIIFYTKRNNEVKVHVDMTGLPPADGPFHYHIHEHPVGANGDCEATGLHFNPYAAPAECDSQKDDSYCQVGDLSGKHGWINTTCFETKYYDPYLSLNPSSPSYLVGRSVVFHYANLTKFACADIVPLSKTKLAALDEINKELTSEYTTVTNSDESLQAPSTDYSYESNGDIEIRLKARDLDDEVVPNKWNKTVPKHNFSNNSNASLNNYESSIYDDAGAISVKSGMSLLSYLIASVLLVFV